MKRVSLLIKFVLIGILCMHAIVLANGLSLSNLTRDSLAQTISVDVQWNNSWRLDGVSAPNNWDAVWVFVKFRPCGASPQAPWSHGNLSATLADHTFGNLEPIRSDGSATGLDPDLKGVLLRRTSAGLFTADPATRITLQVPNMLANTAYHVRVLGIEMVYVSQSGFGIGGIASNNAFSINTVRGDATPDTITSEAAVTINTHSSGANQIVSLPAAFPKGYDAFHMMKYEISEGQYASFLNSLPPIAQFSRYPGNFGTYRQRLNANGVNPLSLYGSTREDRAQNYLSWNDIAAYLDWACLRPMTELEYEKACRGPEAVVTDEYAWGTINIFDLQEITGPEDGTEIPNLLPANAHYSFNNLFGGDGGRGPVRCGIFALPTNATREQSGAGYYGAMELSGNVGEATVGVLGVTSTTGSVAFTGTYGDGQLSANGLANQAGWPLATDGALVLRGGSWYTAVRYLKTADRSTFWNGNRNYDTSGRGVR
ncbi:MAG: formylglycine-generating enzyme family protein [Bacteroidia bacterium]